MTERFLPDTSCIVASILAGHVHHERCRTELGDRVNQGETMVVSAHSLVESYSTLTRLPPPHRVTPSLAMEALVGSFVDDTEVVGLAADSVVRALHAASTRAIPGGAIYDFLIAQTALEHHVDTLITLNGRDFTRFGLPLTIAVPAP